MQNERELWIEEILAQMRQGRELAAPSPSPTPQPGCPDPTDVMDVALEEAPPEVVRRVQSHLPGCDFCQASYAAYRKVIEEEGLVAQEADHEPDPAGSMWELMDAEPEDLVAPKRGNSAWLPMSPSVTDIVRAGDLEEFERLVRPWLPVWLMSVGAKDTLAEELLSYLKGRLPEMAGRRFREALAVWLPEFARQHAGAPAAWDPEARETRGLWRTLMRQADDEDPWARNYRREALQQRVSSKADLRQFRPQEFATQPFLEDYQNDLCRETDEAAREDDQLLNCTVNP